MGDFSILGTRIKHLRTELNKTQREFASIVGCTAATLSAYENGSKNPSLDIVKNIAEKCGVTMDWLCGLANNNESSSSEITTYSDFISIILKLKNTEMAPYEIKFYLFHDKNIYTEETTCIKSGIVTDDPTIYQILSDINRMTDLLECGTIDERIYNDWLDGIMEKYNRPFDTWENMFGKMPTVVTE